MLDPNFSLKCSDGQSVQVSKESLGAFSSVFKDLLGTNPTEGGESCEIAEASDELRVALEVLNGSKEARTMAELKNLLAFALKYDIWALDFFARTHLKQYHLANAQELFTFGCQVHDEEIALQTLKILVHQGFDISGIVIDQGWKIRATHYINATKVASFYRLRTVGVTSVNAGNGPCDACLDSNRAFFNSVTVRAFNKLYTQPTLSGSELVAYMPTPPKPCGCDCTISFETMDWDESLKADEAALDAAF